MRPLELGLRLRDAERRRGGRPARAQAARVLRVKRLWSSVCLRGGWWKVDWRDQDGLARRQLALKRWWDLSMCACIALRARRRASRAAIASRIGLVLGDGRAPGLHGFEVAAQPREDRAACANPRSPARSRTAPRCRRPRRSPGGRRGRPRAASRCGRPARACARWRGVIASTSLALGRARRPAPRSRLRPRGARGSARAAPFGAATGAAARGASGRARRRPSRCAPRPSLRPRARSAPRAPRAGSRPAAWPGRARPAGARRRANSPSAISARSWSAIWRYRRCGSTVCSGTGIGEEGVKGCPELDKW